MPAFRLYRDHAACRHKDRLHRQGCQAGVFAALRAQRKSAGEGESKVAADLLHGDQPPAAVISPKDGLTLGTARAVQTGLNGEILLGLTVDVRDDLVPDVGQRQTHLAGEALLFGGQIQIKVNVCGFIREETGIINARQRLCRPGEGDESIASIFLIS